MDNIEEKTRELYQFVGQPCQDEAVEVVVSKVKKGNYYKWRSELSDAQVKIFEGVAYETLLRFGYDVVSDKKPLPTYFKGFYYIHDRFFRLKHLFVINVVDGIKIKFFSKEPFAD